MQTDRESGASGAPQMSGGGRGPWPPPASSVLRCCGAGTGSALASHASVSSSGQADWEVTAWAPESEGLGFKHWSTTHFVAV